MRALLAVLLVGAAVVQGCAGLAVPGPSTPTPASPAIGPTATPGTPVTSCHGGIEQATCDAAARVALSAVRSPGWAPVHVWISTGQFCPMSEDCLFDPAANFPYPMPPAGGQWVANAEVAFASTDKHAGMNIAAVGSELQAVLIGYAVPKLTWCSGDCPTAAATDGPYQLQLVVPHLDWKTTDPISGLAILSFAGAAPATISGSGHDLIVFSYAEVGGNRRVDPVWTADCGPYQLDPATPLNQRLSKSGGVSGNEPDADFLREFFAGPDIRLPAGTWDITTIAQFYQGIGCPGALRKMQATLRITVADAN